ncbi:hypothetical protein [Tabrizicola piscis]|uniref:hypothetical protein n=1 Tax=Tabrizicola piscis TaxID=2494374 RepID=UPI0013DE571A|nr:hypothetical protein [Tabrizicola piscis]
MTFGSLPIGALPIGGEIPIALGMVKRTRWIAKLQLDENFASKRTSAQPTANF